MAVAALLTALSSAPMVSVAYADETTAPVAATCTGCKAADCNDAAANKTACCKAAADKAASCKAASCKGASCGGDE